MPKCKNCSNLYNLSNDDEVNGKWCAKAHYSPDLEIERNCIYYKTMTNADRIRNMTDEELADMLHNVGSYVEDGEPLIEIWIGEHKTTLDDSFGDIKEWLQSEAEQE